MTINIFWKSQLLLNTCQVQNLLNICKNDSSSICGSNIRTFACEQESKEQVSQQMFTLDLSVCGGASWSQTHQVILASYSLDFHNIHWNEILIKQKLNSI